GALNQNQIRNPTKAARATIMPISSPTEIYFPTIFPASDRSDRSGPVKGVTRFIRTTPLIIPSSSQREKAITLAKILLRNRYTTVVVVKIKKALYRKISGRLVIYLQASTGECLETASI